MFELLDHGLHDAGLVDRDAGRRVPQNLDFHGQLPSCGVTNGRRVAWGDGASTVQTPVAGKVSLNHAYATTGTKDAVVTLVEGALTWSPSSRDDAYGDQSAGTEATRARSPSASSRSTGRSVRSWRT